jgi:hypothetical protein
VLAVSVAVVVAIACFVLAVVALVLIIWAPWRSVRDEPPLDPDIEARLLLHEDPDQIAQTADANAPVTDVVTDLYQARDVEHE